MIERVGEQLLFIKPGEVQKQTIQRKQVLETETEEQRIPKNEEDLQKLAEQFNKVLEPESIHLKFEYHEDLKEYYAVLIHTESQEVIKEVPARKTLDRYAFMKEFIGLLFDKKI